MVRRAGVLEATPLGLEPRIREPKSLVLPITPRSNPNRPAGSKVFLTGMDEVYTLFARLTTGVFG